MTDSLKRMGTTKEKKGKHKKIDKAHPEFELTYDMMLGIRTSVGHMANVPHDLQYPEDFKDASEVNFKAKGSSTTPPHKMRDFKFKDYAPKVFFAIRRLYGIDAADYMLTLCGDF